MPTINSSVFCAGELAHTKILVIGHDRRLNRSSIMAEPTLFAHYFLRPVATKPFDSAKYKLAESLFSYIGRITNFRFLACDMAVTNLCKSPLPHAAVSRRFPPPSPPPDSAASRSCPSRMRHRRRRHHDAQGQVLLVVRHKNHLRDS